MAILQRTVFGRPRPAESLMCPLTRPCCQQFCLKSMSISSGQNISGRAGQANSGTATHVVPGTAAPRQSGGCGRDDSPAGTLPAPQAVPAGRQRPTQRRNIANSENVPGTHVFLFSGRQVSTKWRESRDRASVYRSIKSNTTLCCNTILALTSE